MTRGSRHLDASRQRISAGLAKAWAEGKYRAVPLSSIWSDRELVARVVSYCAHHSYTEAAHHFVLSKGQIAGLMWRMRRHKKRLDENG